MAALDRAARLTLHDDAGPFEVTLVEAPEPSRLVLFAVGGGGNPERHLPLLSALAGHGCTVAAPHFERLTSPRVAATDLLLRAGRLRLALAAGGPADLPVAAVGHSIGAATLLALAGGQLWLEPPSPLGIPPEPRLGRLVLLAPATDFFAVAGSLDAVRAPILAWAGTVDAITPPSHAERLRDLRPDLVEVRLAQGAGHFSFMDAPPPGTAEPLPDREAFLQTVARESCRFVAR